MNPLNLLTKGRTLKGLGNRSGDYRLAPKGVLPNFNVNKRSYQLPPAPLAAAAPVPVLEAAQPSLPVQPLPAPEPVLLPAAATAPVAAAPVTRPILPVQPVQPLPPVPTVRGPGLVQRVSHFGRGLVQRFVYGQKPRPIPGRTVQTELALDKITVKRNTLNEDDLEVVLVQRKIGTEDRPLARLTRMEMTGDAWIKLTAPFRKRAGEHPIAPRMKKKETAEAITRA